MSRSKGKTTAIACGLSVIAVTTFLFSIMPATGAAQQAERVAVGDQAIDFALESIDGESFRLSDLRGDRNAVIIFFRGTW